MFKEQGVISSWTVLGLVQGASQGASEKSGILWTWEGPLGTPLGLVQWPSPLSKIHRKLGSLLCLCPLS